MNKKPLWNLIIWLAVLTTESLTFAGILLYFVYFVPSFYSSRGIVLFIGLPFMLVLMCLIAWVNLHAYFHPEQESE